MWFTDRTTDIRPLVLHGAYDALSARVLETAGAEAIYLGSYAVAASRLAAPDVGLLSAAEVAEQVRVVREAVSSRLVVDIDTGYGGPSNVRRTVAQMASLGVDVVQIEDQINPKRCGHFGGKEVVSADDAVRRVEAAVQAGRDRTAIIARTDSLAPLGMAEAIHRAQLFEKAGAAGVMVDAITDLDQVESLRAAIALPIVYNTADTGMSPDMTVQQAQYLGIGVLLRPIELLFAAWRSVGEAARRMVSESDDGAFPSDRGATFARMNQFLRLDEIRSWEDALGHGTASHGVDAAGSRP